jgi:hypothetical protein
VPQRFGRIGLLARALVDKFLTFVNTSSANRSPTVLCEGRSVERELPLESDGVGRALDPVRGDELRLQVTKGHIMKRFITTQNIARGSATALVSLALSLGGSTLAHAYPGGAGGGAAGAGAPSSNPAAPGTQAGGTPVGAGVATPSNPTGAPQAGVGAPTAVNPTGTITPAGTNPTGTGTSTTGNSASAGTPTGIGMTPPAALSLTSPAGSASNPALNSGTAGVTNGVPNSAAMQSNSQSQFGPGMNPQFGAVPGTLGSPSSSYGVAPNSSQMGTNNYGPYGQSTPNAAANSATTGSRNWGGPVVSWQPGYGSWSSGYAGAGSSATPSNGSTGYRGLPGSSTQTNVLPGTAPQTYSSVPATTYGASGMENYEMNNQGPLAFRRGPSPYNTGALNNSAPIGGYSYGYR